MNTSSLRAGARAALAGIPPRGRYLILLSAIIAGGAGLSLLSFIDVWRGERVAERAAFEAAADLRLTQIQQEIDATLDAVETLATFFESSEAIEPTEFRRFAEGLFHRLPAVRALQWIEHVPAAARARFESRSGSGGPALRIWEPGDGGRVAARQRAAYFPVRYIAPGEDAADVVGFDVGFEQRRREALVTAARAGQAMATQPITLILGEQRQPAVLVVRPVYGDDGMASLRGYTSSAIAIADLAKRVLEKPAGREVAFSIFERTAAGRGELLYGAGRRDGGGAAAGLVHSGLLAVAGQIWEVELTPASGFARAGLGSVAWIVLIGGLVATAILFFYVRSLYRSALSAHLSTAALRLRDRAIEASTNAIVIVRVDRDTPTIEYANAAFERITGFSKSEVVGREWRVLQGGSTPSRADEGVEALLRSGDEGAMLLRSYRKNGAPFWNSLHIAPVRGEDGGRSHVVAIIDDVTENKSYQEQLEHQATHDVLTGLPNRALLLDRVNQAIAHARRSERLMALIFVDLDHFKRINDGYGHSTGDEVLRTVASRVASALRADDTVARYAGDEFVIVVNDQVDEHAVEHFCRRLSSVISEPLRIDDREILLSASIGVSLFPRDGSDAETLIQNADTAMYRVKDEGRGSTRFFTQDIGTDLHLRLTLEQSLRRALERGEFFLEYQPRIDLADGKLSGVEALVRWERPGHGRVAPAHFIGLAEDSGLIVPIGEWVLETACRQALAWTEAYGPIAISVNLSPRQFRQRDLVDLIARVLSASGLEPGRLELEVTESTMMHDVHQATRTLRGLSELGVRLALDDFGTGYSSLAYLKTFPIDDLKIDRSFVRDVVHDKEDAQISRAIIGLARTLGLHVVAEGVENTDQLRFLCEHGCDEGQGFLFAKPLGADALAHWRADWDPARFEFTSTARGRVIPMRR